MSPRTPRRLAGAVLLVAVPAALTTSGLAVAQASSAAYSSVTAGPVASWASGTVALSDDDAGTAAFGATDLRPGSTGSRCVVVSSSGALPATVRLYGTGASSTRALADSIELVVTQGSGGRFGSCSGFTPLATGADVYAGTLGGFAVGSTGYATGVGAWSTAGVAAGAPAETRTYRLTYRVRPDAPGTTQGGTAALGFTWEAQGS